LGRSGSLRRRRPLITGRVNAGEGSVLCHRRKKNLYLEHFIFSCLCYFRYCNCLCQTMASWAWMWSSFSLERLLATVLVFIYISDWRLEHFILPCRCCFWLL
jgi:hypothetical protein